MGEPSNRSNLSKAIVIIFMIGMIVFIVGYATDYWHKTEVSHQGLWRWCALGICTEGSFSDILSALDDDNISWFEATQAFETLGFIAAVAALVLIVLYIFVPQTSGKRIVFVLALIACFAAAGCIILGVIIYGSKVEHNLSWSFALCCIAGIIFAISGILLVIDMVKR